MKSLSLLILAILLFHSSNGQNTHYSKFSFDKKTIKLTKVRQGVELNIVYPFINNGNNPLIISDIKVACSCTKAIWPTTPTLPGLSDTIKVNVDTKSMIGWQDRILEIYSNSPSSPDKIRFKVMIDTN